MNAVLRTKQVGKTHVRGEYISDIHAIDNLCLYMGNRMVGRALMIPTPTGATVLLDIYIYHEDDRGRGFGDELMRHITESYDHVITGWLSTAGRDLCLKHGFKLVKGMFAKDKDTLIYKKGAANGHEDGSPETGGSEGAEREGCEGSVEQGRAEVREEGSVAHASENGARTEGRGQEEGPQGKAC